MLNHYFFVFYSNELQTCDWPRNVLCNRASRKRQHVDVAKSRIDVEVSSSEDAGPHNIIITSDDDLLNSAPEVTIVTHQTRKTVHRTSSVRVQEEDLRHPRVIEEETADLFDSFGKKHVPYQTDKILNDADLADKANGGGSSKRKVNHIIPDESNVARHNTKVETSNRNKQDAKTGQDETERSFIHLDATILDNSDAVDVKDRNGNEKVEEEEQDLSAIPSKLLHKNTPVYENLEEDLEDVDIASLDDADIDLYDYDFEDYIAKLEADDQFYYINWNDPIYDEFYDEKTGKKVQGWQTVDSTAKNVTVDYSNYPQRYNSIIA